MAKKTFTGKSEDASAPILNADFWKKGTTIKGRVIAPFETANGICYQIETDREIKVKANQMSNQESDVTGNLFSVGALAGFEMALRAARVSSLLPDDEVEITCTGKTDTGKGSPRVDFSIKISRD